MRLRNIHNITGNWTVSVGMPAAEAMAALLKDRTVTGMVLNALDYQLTISFDDDSTLVLNLNETDDVDLQARPVP